MEFNLLHTLDLKNLFCNNIHVETEEWIDVAKDCDPNLSTLIYQGDLKKRTNYKFSQRRTFLLYSDGRLEYYKDQVLYRGTLQLTSKSRVTLTQEKIDGRLSFFPGIKWVLRVTFDDGKEVCLSANKTKEKKEEEII